MKLKTLLIFLFFVSLESFSQNNITIQVFDSLTKEKLFGVSASFLNTKISANTDTSGFASFNNIPDGKQILKLFLFSYKNKQLTFNFPEDNKDIVVKIFLSEEATEIEEVTVSTTRTNSHIDDVPLKVEVIGADDVNEENSIKPGNVSSLLGDISGIQIQQTSSVSGNSNIRIQGLGGKYTQILRDGMLIFEGFSGDFGIMQLPPLDLKQIEIVKGPASTLYGGGAIGGIINLITKEPTLDRDASMTMNYTSLNEKNVNLYFAQRVKNKGYTFFSGTNIQNAVDVDKDNFSDVPETRYAIIHPKLFFYFKNRTKLSVGLTGIYEKRRGGDMFVLNGDSDSVHKYYEQETSYRNVFDFQFSNTSANKNIFSLKGAFGFFNKQSETSSYIFDGYQMNIFSEASYLIQREKYDLVIGANYVSDNFQTTKSSYAYISSFQNGTAGAFIQHTWKPKPKFVLETGLRGDYNFQYGFFALPRFAMLYKINDIISLRFNSGMGYKTPNPFVHQYDEDNPNRILPIADSVKAENSLGGSFEFVFKHFWENGFGFFADQSFFYSQIDNPVITGKDVYQRVYFYNASKSVVTQGSDTYVRIVKDEFEIYLGYTFTNAKQMYDTINSIVRFYPSSRFATVISYDVEKICRFGIEASYFGSQVDETGAEKPGYLFMAAMLGWNLKSFSFVLNCENLLDFRQNKLEQVVYGNISSPSFKPLWAPIDGRAINFSVRVKF